MKTNISKTQIGLISALLISLIFSAIIYSTNGKIKKEFLREKVNSESLLSEKLNLDKSIEKINKELKEMNVKNTKLDESIKSYENKLKMSESEIRKLNAVKSESYKLKEKINELEKIQADLNKKFIAQNSEIEGLNQEKAMLNNQIADMNSKMELLNMNNSILLSLAANNYRIEALKGKKDKLTVNARRTEKLLVSFDLPRDAEYGFYFIIETPEAEEFSSKKDLTASIRFIDNSDKTLTSSINSPSGKIQLKRAEMSYKPEEKLSKGIYVFKLYDKDDTFIGSSQIRLR